MYTNLPAGIYTFQVKACSSDGVWGSLVTDMLLTVHPPLWLTVWAKIVYALCVLAFILFYPALLLYKENRINTG